MNRPIMVAFGNTPGTQPSPLEYLLVRQGVLEMPA